MTRPNRDDYALCECRQAQVQGQSICGGCEEYDAAMREWLYRNDPYEAADALADQLKDEDFRHG